MRLDSRWLLPVLALALGACGKTTDSEPNVGTSGGGGMPSGLAGANAGGGESSAGGTGGVLVLDPGDSGPPGEPDGGWLVEQHCGRIEELLGEEFFLTLRIDGREWRLTDGGDRPPSPPVLLWGRFFEESRGIDVIASGLSTGISLSGDDIVTLFDQCEAAPGMFPDGRMGSDTLVTPVSVSTLQSSGVAVSRFEAIQIDDTRQYLSDCFQ